MTKEVTQPQLLQIAHAYGLGGDYMQAKRRDFFGPLVICKHDSGGFLTKVDRDHVRRAGSTIAVHDGKSIRWVTGWEDCIFEKGATQHKAARACKESSYYCQLFYVHEATFVATETYGIPERVFLFVNEPDFDVGYIADYLAEYRRRKPPNIFPLGMRYRNAKSK